MLIIIDKKIIIKIKYKIIFENGKKMLIIKLNKICKIVIFGIIKKKNIVLEGLFL